MSRTPLERLTCDRCEDEDIVGAADPDGFDSAGAGDKRRADWGELLVVNLQRVTVLGGDDGPVTLCGSCLAELLQWYRNEKPESVTRRELAARASSD